MVQKLKILPLSVRLRNGNGDHFQQVLNVKCGMFGVSKPMYLFSIQKSTFLLTNEVNSGTKTWNSNVKLEMHLGDFKLQLAINTSKCKTQNVGSWCN